MTDPAERLLADTLRSRADHASYDPTGLDAVVTTARGIRRRQRRTTAAVAAVAVIALTVPTAVFVHGRGASSTPEPTGPVPSLIDVRDLDRGPDPHVSYVEGHDFVGTDGSRHVLPIDGGITAITPYHGGFLVADDHVVGTSVGLHQIDGQGREISSSCTTGSPVLSADQLDTVWVELPCAQGAGAPSSVILRGIASGMGDGEARQEVPMAVLLVGVLDQRVVYTGPLGTGGAWVTDLQRPATRIPGLASAGGVSPRGLVSGQLEGDGTTGAVVDPDTGEVVWRAEQTVLQGFSPDGRLVLGIVDKGTGYCCQEVLDARNGHPVADVERTLNQLGVASVPVVWEDNTHVLAIVGLGEHRAIIRVGLDGSLERATDLLPRSEPLVFAATP